MKLILFDVDGTLVHSDKKDSYSFADTYEELYGRPFPTVDWRKYPHVTDTTIMNTVIQDHFKRPFSRQEWDAFQQRYINKLQQNRRRSPADFKSVNGAAPLVNELLARPDCRVGVGTGGWKAPAMVKLKHVGINIAEQVVVGADGKSRREAILEEAITRAQETSSRPFEKIVYIGDAEWDVRTTRNIVYFGPSDPPNPVSSDPTNSEHLTPVMLITFRSI
jgi:phosphoglycolate phosphatase-like HAD superfamily hydrolase